MHGREILLQDYYRKYIPDYWSCWQYMKQETTLKLCSPLSTVDPEIKI